MKYPLNMTVNGQAVSLMVQSHHSLLDVLRDQLDMRGTHRGCNSGECGACTVHLNGKAVTSCLVLAVDAEGAQVLTVEGLRQNGALHPLQEAFIEFGAVQCGYCTSGMLMAALFLLNHNPHPTELEVRTALAGNLCRCTGYAKIIQAIMAAGGRS